METAGSAALDGVTVTTGGEAAHAITATGVGSTVTLAGTNSLTTIGNGAVGIFAGSGGVVTGTGSVSITTSGTNALSNGLSSFGVNADGSGSSITLASATISTSGEGAVGLLASDRNNTGSGGVITVNGALNVTTQQTFAYDVFASGDRREDRPQWDDDPQRRRGLVRPLCHRRRRHHDCRQSDDRGRQCGNRRWRGGE